MFKYIIFNQRHFILTIVRKALQLKHKKYIIYNEKQCYKKRINLQNIKFTNIQKNITFTNT